MRKHSLLATAGFFALFLFSNKVFSQNEFDKYGPFGSPVYKDLKEALRTGRGVYKMDLSYQELDKRLYEKLPTLTDLQALKLSGNAITGYPEGFEKLSNLLYFATYNNKFRTFLPFPASYRDLQYLELQHTEIDSIPASIAYLNRLQSFKFGNTDDTLRLPGTLAHLKNLKDITIENCIMDSLPDALFEVGSLTYLNLSNTNTHYLSKDFGALSQLEVLVIENNQLTHIPFEIYKAQKLRIISFRGNKLTKIPDSISQLENLSILDVRGNLLDAEEIEELKALLPGCEVRS